MNSKHFIKVFLVCIGFVCLFNHSSYTKTLDETSFPLPTERLAVSLIYQTIITINNASQSRNYSVLRALSAPEFQTKYSLKELHDTLDGLQANKIDLKEMTLFDPVIEKKQILRSEKIFRLKGYMPTAPIRMRFEFQYQYVKRKWRLFAMSLDFVRDEVKSAKKSRREKGI